MTAQLCMLWEELSLSAKQKSLAIFGKSSYSLIRSCPDSRKTSKVSWNEAGVNIALSSNAKKRVTMQS